MFSLGELTVQILCIRDVLANFVSGACLHLVVASFSTLEKLIINAYEDEASFDLAGHGNVEKSQWLEQ